MEDIGDFVVLKQLVTFCPQVLKYIYMYIYYTIARAPYLFYLSHGKVSCRHEETDADQNVKPKD